MKKIHKIPLILTVLILTLLISVTASADLKGYLIKEGSTVYYYDADELGESFLNDDIEKANNELYLDFKLKFSENGFYAFYDGIKGYKNYSVIEEAFIDSEEPTKFNINEFLASNKALAISNLPSVIEEVYEENKIIKYRHKNSGDNLDLAVEKVYFMTNTYIKVEFNKELTDSDIRNSNFIFTPSINIMSVEKDLRNSKIAIIITEQRKSGTGYTLSFKGNSK